MPLLVACVAAFILAIAMPAGAEAPQGVSKPPKGVKRCLKCHEGAEDVVTFADGSEMSVAVNGQAFLDSVHGTQLDCVDCHQGYDKDHGTDREFANRRAYTLASHEICKRCHFDTYARTLENVHYQYLKEGRDDVPACSDCHGAHEIHDPHQKRAMISQSCGRCHEEVYATYAKSVHGAALSADNPDVPACADCHTAHRIAAPGPSGFHLSSPQVCIRCHADETLMKRYDLPTTVASTYLADFHGVTASLSHGKDTPADKVVVVCVDCHGYHFIESAAQEGVERMRQRAAEACVKCHQGAPVGFPAAWLSHYPPSLKNAPIVFAVQVLYRILIPFMVMGLALQVGLHFYRVGLRRRG